MPASCELMSVAIDLDRERLSMVWSATLPVASQYPPEEFAQTETRVRFA